MKFFFTWKTSHEYPVFYSKFPAGFDGFIGYGEDAEAAIKSVFGRVTDELLDLIEGWEILTNTCFVQIMKGRKY